MNWTTPQKTDAKTIDPRIDSPEIKVVYPSMVYKESSVQVQQEPIVSDPVKPLPTSANEQAPAQTITAMPIAQETTAASPARETWQEVIRKNATLFIVVALISALAGLIIGNKI